VVPVSRLIEELFTGAIEHLLTIKPAVLSERGLQYPSICFFRREEGCKTGSRNLLFGHSECTLVFLLV